MHHIWRVLRLAVLVLLLAATATHVAAQTPAPSAPRTTPTPETQPQPVQAAAQEEAEAAPGFSRRVSGRSFTSIVSATHAISPTAPPPILERFTPQEGDVVRQINPGVAHIYRETDDPLKINVLVFDLTAPAFAVRPGIGDGWLSAHTRPSYMAQQTGALAAVNGDLFSGSGLPQGLTMIDSQVVIPPKHRATFAWGRDGEPFIGYFTDTWSWHAEMSTASGATHPLNDMNRACELDWVCLYNHFTGSLPYQYGDVKVLLGPSGRVFDIVQESQLLIDPGMRVLQGTGEGAEWLLDNVQINDTITITTTTDPPLSEYTQAISGGPIILDNGEFVQDCLCLLDDCSLTETNEVRGLLCEEFDTDWKLHHYYDVYMPRTGVGFDSAKTTLIVAVVDGYQLGFSRGMLQTEFADLLREFGADRAMELDGGGSVTMVLREEYPNPWYDPDNPATTETLYEYEIKNNPSDATGERYVANALLFFWNDEHQQVEQPALPGIQPPALRPD
jgi:hypothetical protein